MIAEMPSAETSADAPPRQNELTAPIATSSQTARAPQTRLSIITERVCRNASFKPAEAHKGAGKQASEDSVQLSRIGNLVGRKGACI